MYHIILRTTYFIVKGARREEGEKAREQAHAEPAQDEEEAAAGAVDEVEGEEGGEVVHQADRQVGQNGLIDGMIG